MRQLFHLGVIEAFSGTLKKNKESEQMKPYDVTVSPELEKMLMDALEYLSLMPILIVSTFCLQYRHNSWWCCL